MEDLAGRQKKFYNEWERYRALYDNITVDWYLRVVKYFCSYLDHGCQVVDLGCGIGIATNVLKNRFASTIGLDYSFEFCKRARERGEKNILFINGDATSLPMKDESVDGIFCFSTIEHIYDVHKASNEMDRVLKKEGIILIHMPNLLTPLRPIKAILSREKLKNPRPESGEGLVHSIYLIFRNIFFILRKYGSKNANFLYREPDLEIIEGDYDAVYLSSPIDIKKYFRRRNYEINDLTHIYRPYRGKSKIKGGLKWLMYKTGVLQMIKMPPGTYSTLLLRKG